MMAIPWDVILFEAYVCFMTSKSKFCLLSVINFIRHMLLEIMVSYSLWFIFIAPDWLSVVKFIIRRTKDQWFEAMFLLSCRPSSLKKYLSVYRPRTLMRKRMPCQLCLTYQRFVKSNFVNINPFIAYFKKMHFFLLKRFFEC